MRGFAPGHRIGPIQRIILGAIVLAAAMMLRMGAPAAEPPKLALVIGNSDYRIGALRNPGNDSDLIAQTLRQAGFEVHLHQDLTFFEMGRIIADFGRLLKESGEDTIGLFYYAGHAVQAQGVNYLVPVDVELVDELDLPIKTIPMALVMQSLRVGGSRLNLVFLDSCRNNPFAALTRSGGGGLARIDAPYGTLISYATAPGSVARDGDGRNSPYTAALSRALKIPGLTVEQALKRVRLEVAERTNGSQVPWESSSLIGDFYFAGLAPEAPVAETAKQAPAPVDPSRFEPNTVAGVELAGDVSVGRVFWKQAYEESKHIHFVARPRGILLDGEQVAMPFFSIFADFTETTKRPEDLFLLRLVIQQRYFLDQESHDTGYEDCPLGFRLSASGHKTVRLLLYKKAGSGPEDTNYCVLKKMGERDRRFWAAMVKNVGVYLRDHTEEKPVVDRLSTFYSTAMVD